MSNNNGIGEFINCIQLEVEEKGIRDYIQRRKLKFVSAIEYPFNTQSLFFFTQIMTAITIIGIILIIPINAGPSIAILE